MNVRKSVPVPLRRAGRRASVAVGTWTADLRSEPGFLLVGAQRCGTTSLYRALMSHPRITPPVLHKGVNYFDVNYERGWRWYVGHFPVRLPRADSEPRLAFDASGYYMFHPHAPGRIVRDLPEVKVVAMVRDPVERAYSAYQHEYARGFETQTWPRALELEDSRVEPELQHMLDDPGYESFSYRHHAYRRRGHYARQLQPFVEVLGQSRVHIVESERFFENPEEEFTRLLRFLELPVVMPPTFDRYNPRPRNPMPAEIRAELSDHFQPYDAELERLLGGRPPRWRE